MVIEKSSDSKSVIFDGTDDDTRTLCVKDDSSGGSELQSTVGGVKKSRHRMALVRPRCDIWHLLSRHHLEGCEEAPSRERQNPSEIKIQSSSKNHSLL